MSSGCSKVLVVTVMMALGAEAEVRVWKQPAEMPRFTNMTVTVEGRELDLIEAPMPQNRLFEANRAPYAYAMFESEGPAELVIKAGEKTLKERVPGPGHYVFEPNGRHRALVVTVFGKPCEVVRDGKTVYFGPGFHQKDVVTLKAGETLFLDEGAVLDGTVVGAGDGIRMCGRGILSGARFPHVSGPVNPETGRKVGNLACFSGNGIRVEDVTFFSSFSWTLHLRAVTNAVVDNVSVVCGRVINDDGIDVSRAKDVVIRNSFIRAQDDCVAPKWFCEDLMVSNCVLWCDVANAVRIGWECEKPPYRFRNLVFRNLDIRHLSLQPSPPEAFWCDTCFLVQAANGITMEDLRFEDIRIRESDRVGNLAILKTMGFRHDEKYSPLEPGYIRKVSFEKITRPQGKALPIYQKPQDAKHAISEVIER